MNTSWTSRLPGELQRDHAAAGGGELAAVARALYDYEGNLGETYVVTDGRGLVFYSRRPGESFTARRFAFDDLDQLEVSSDRTFQHLKVRPGPEAAWIDLKFSSWEGAALGRIAALWVEATGRSPGLAQTVESPPAEAPPCAPRLALCASLVAMIHCDDRTAPEELEYVTRLFQDAEAIAEGTQWLADHGIDALLGQLDTVLDRQQKRCLTANLLGVALVDGMLRTREQELMDRFLEALHLPETEYQSIYDVLMMKHDLRVFA
jgi:uncharacterized tellurite resistance protein B-like protein